MRCGLELSLNASYSPKEIAKVLQKTKLDEFEIRKIPSALNYGFEIKKAPI